RVKTILYTTLSRIDDLAHYDEYKEEVVKLEKYLERNWASIKPLKQRNLPVTDGIGVCESGHRPFSYRMKHQGRGFTKKGARNLAAVISARRNGTFLEILTTELPAFQEEVSDPFKNAVRNALKKAKVQPSIGALS